MRLKNCLRCEGRIVGLGLQRLCAECTVDWKWCMRCEQIKSREECKLLNGRPLPYCYPCSLGMNRERNKTSASKRTYYIGHLRRKFSITIDEAERLEAIRICEICGWKAEDEAEARKQLRVDHSHSSGAIRGVVCRKCNLGLAIIEADPDWLNEMRAYLDRE